MSAESAREIGAARRLAAGGASAQPGHDHVPSGRGRPAGAAIRPTTSASTCSASAGFDDGRRAGRGDRADHRRDHRRDRPPGGGRLRAPRGRPERPAAGDHPGHPQAISRHRPAVRAVRGGGRRDGRALQRAGAGDDPGLHDPELPWCCATPRWSCESGAAAGPGKKAEAAATAKAGRAGWAIEADPTAIVRESVGERAISPQAILQRAGEEVPGRLVGGLQRRRDVGARPEEERHLGQDVPGRDRLDVGHRHRARVVGRHDQRPAGGQLEILLLQRVPDRLVDPLGIVRAREGTG